MTFSVQPCQKLASSTPAEEFAARTWARAVATRPSVQPRIGDQQIVSAKLDGGAVGGDHPTGPSFARAVRVAVNTSGRVEVTTTGPGASRTRGMTT